MTYLNPDFEEKIKSLPEDLQKAILNLDLHRKMTNIWSKYDLLISDGNVIYQEVEKVLTGEKKASDFPENIVSQLRDTDKETFLKIVADVDKEIFQPIKEDLMKIEGLKNSALNKDEVEEDHLKLNKNEILSGIEKPISSSFLSRLAKLEAESSDSKEAEEEKTYKSIVASIVNDPSIEIELKEKEEEERVKEAEATIAPKLANSASLYNITEKLRNRDLNATTDAKKLEDKRREQLEKNATSGGTAGQAGPDRLNEVVRAPRQSIDVKPAVETPPKPAAPDPYREPV